MEQRNRTLEKMVNSPCAQIWQGRPVFLTGHTGFKGGWLSTWLHTLGADVHGYSLAPLPGPGLFDAAGVASTLGSHTIGDLRDLPALKAALQAAAPEVVFHLAAQPLVREGYSDPLTTIGSNVVGTVNLLEAVREVPSVRCVVVVTTDKVYENREWDFPYREVDPLGGHDPYSASKAAAEILTASYRASFFGGPGRHPALVATARAGNVIGGGDWAADRLVPDCLKALAEDRPIELRFPGSTRPWQHVLEPVGGYITLAEALLSPTGASFANAWNFGPDPSGNAPVQEIALKLAALYGKSHEAVKISQEHAPHEAGLLALDSSRARRKLGWTPRWNLDEALRKTVEWQNAWLAGEDMGAITREQIQVYQESPSA